MAELLQRQKLYEELERQERLENMGERKEYIWAELDQTDVSDYDHLVPKSERAIEYDFPLDDFQKRAFYKIYQGQHVFVSAHTSAGKTITAEWAIALAMASGRKAVYTSPIKALSNQKFRDFRVKFNHIELDEISNSVNDYYYSDEDDYYGGGYSGGNIYDFGAYNDNDSDERVGIITGDIQLNQSAPCLIQTTEILRTMIYDNDPILQELEWVIFDEIHYMNDPERGRVWEEVITMLPDHVNMLFLSATTPNAMEFSEWVGQTRNRKVYVVATPKRPIPLEHYLYIGTHDKDLIGYYKSQEELRSDEMDRLIPNDESLDQKIKEIMKKKYTKSSLRDNIDPKLTESDGTYLVVDSKNKYHELVEKEVKHIIRERRGDNTKKSALSFRQQRHHWISLFKLLEIKKKFPVVVFVFSKKMCTTLTEHLEHKDYTYKREKSYIKVFIDKCLKRLKPEDRTLPQITKTVELLTRGIALHHGGLLPILKEITEILFSRGFIRILFATETFAMGINMPTRSVVFSSVSKHDGQEFRDLLPGEYTQMSGRAGRRGLDDVGTVIVTHWKPSRTVYKTLISGKPLTIVSQFRLTYQTILSMLSKNSIEGGVTGLMRKSFSEFGNNKDERQVARTNRLIRQATSELALQEKDVDGEGVKIWSLLNEIGNLMYNCLNDMYGPRVFSKLFKSGRKILVCPDKTIYPIPMEIVKVEMTYLTAKYISLPPPEDSEDNVDNKRDKDSSNPEDLNIPIKINYEWIVALCEDLEVSHTPYHHRVDKIRHLNVKRYGLPFHCSHNLLKITELIDKIYQFSTKDFREDAIKKIKDYNWLSQRIEKMTIQVSEKALSLFPDYNKKIELLKQLEFINSEEVLTLKGKIATRINTCHELVLTEFILEAGLMEMTTPQLAALLSCFISNEVKSDNNDYRDVGDFDMELFLKLKKVEQMVENILTAQQDLEIEIDPERFKKECFNPSIVKLVYYWASGEDFSEIMKYTQVMEGTIVRSIMRLDELCQEIIRSADIIGDPSINEIMTRVSDVLRRDIVFCGSLYTT